MAQNQAGQEKIIYNSKKRKINKSPKNNLPPGRLFFYDCRKTTFNHPISTEWAESYTFNGQSSANIANS